MSKRNAIVLSLVGAFFCLWAGVTLWANAPTTTPKKPTLEGPITAIVDATIHTMVAGEAPYTGVILLQGGRIKDVGELVAIPPTARVINARGKVITPGLSIANTRLGLVEISLEKSTRNDSVRGAGAVRADFHVRTGFNHNSPLIPIARVEGITSVMTRPFGGLISGQSMLVSLGGKVADMVIHETLGVHAAIHSGKAAASWTRLEQVFEDAKFFLSNQTDYDMRRARKLQITRSQLLVLGRVIRRHIPLILEVHRASDILQAIRFARENQLRVVLVGASEGWRVAKALASSFIPVILQRPYNLPSRFDRLANRYDNAALLHKAGVLFAMGAGGGAHNIRSIRHEAGIAVAWGLPKSKALRSLTHNLFEIFNLTKERGSLEQGKWADVVLWSGDPLELSTRAERVWLKGELMPMRSRQTLLRERYRSLQGIYRQPRPPIVRRPPVLRPQVRPPATRPQERPLPPRRAATTQTTRPQPR